MCSTFAGTITLISNILEIFSFRDLNLLFFWSQGHEVAAKVSDFRLMWSAQPYAQACGLLGGRNGHCTLFLFEYSSTNFVGNLDSSDDSRVLRCVCKCRRRQPRQVKSSFYQGHLELCTAVCPQFGWKTCHVWRVWCDEVLWAFITHVLPLEKELTT